MRAWVLVSAALSFQAQAYRVDVTAAAPNLLKVSLVQEQRLLATQQPYQAAWYDRIKNSGRDRWLVRGLTEIGALVGPDLSILYPFDQLEKGAIDPDTLQKQESYLISSQDKGCYPTARRPLSVNRSSRPIGVARTGFWQFGWQLRHDYFLTLPCNLEEGVEYSITTSDGLLGLIRYQHHTKKNYTPSIHINQVGFRPDEAKEAFLSLWKGDGGDHLFDQLRRFSLLDESTDEEVYSAAVGEPFSSHQGEDGSQQNYTGSSVYPLNFTAFKLLGRYRLCVEHFACSLPFSIDDDVWRQPFKTALKGLYQQRSGIELTENYSQYTRPRNMHPDDGVVVYQSTTPLMETKNGLNVLGQGEDNFSQLLKGLTEKRVVNGWGGYADAGDWDRRVQHLDASRVLLQLYQLFPDRFDHLDLNIPESANQLPDILDEALWGLDFFRRMQNEEGGIAGGIESENHPRFGEASWQESQRLIAYAAGSWSSYYYAGVAARAARILDGIDKNLASIYASSALKAMNWAENQWQQQENYQTVAGLTDSRNLAALELWLLTKEDHWWRLFEQHSVFNQPRLSARDLPAYDQSEAAYLLVTELQAGGSWYEHAKQAVLAEADLSVTLSRLNAFHWTKRDAGDWIGWGLPAVPQVSNLIFAHHLTADKKYLDTITKAAQFGLGANPLNTSFTTGVGLHFPQNPLHQDSRVTAQTAPVGLTVNGPISSLTHQNHWFAKIYKGVLYPDLTRWPVMEAWFDIYGMAEMTEFSIQGTMAPNIFAWGYLDARAE